MNFELTKYKIFLGKGTVPLSTPDRGQPSGPLIIFVFFASVAMLGRIIKFWSFIFLTETYFIGKWRM